MYKRLEKIAVNVRLDILEMIYQAGKGHIGGSFSVVEILIAIFENFDLKDDTDNIILSKGHASTALYAVLKAFNFLDGQDIYSFTKNGTIFGGHPDNVIPTVKIGTGSLGHGLGIGCGIALEKKMDNQKGNVIVVCGDGEMSEGSVWEAMIFAAKHKLDNLILIVDRNKQMVLDFTEDCINLGDLSKKIADFGFHTSNIGGHNFLELEKSVIKFKTEKKMKPYCIVADTVKGKGVKFMEKDLQWHHKVPNEQQYLEAKKILKGYC